MARFHVISLFGFSSTAEVLSRTRCASDFRAYQLGRGWPLGVEPTKTWPTVMLTYKTKKI